MLTFLLEGRYVTNSYIYHLLYMSVIKYKYTYLNLPVPNERSTFTLHGTIAESDASFILQRVDVTSDDQRGSQPASRDDTGRVVTSERYRGSVRPDWSSRCVHIGTGARRMPTGELLERRGICCVVLFDVCNFVSWVIIWVV